MAFDSVAGDKKSLYGQGVTVYDFTFLIQIFQGRATETEKNIVNYFCLAQGKIPLQRLQSGSCLPP